jgi:hypothetical protein
LGNNHPAGRPTRRRTELGRIHQQRRADTERDAERGERQAQLDQASAFVGR